MTTLNKSRQNPLKYEICEKEFKSSKGLKNLFNIVHQLMEEHQCNIFQKGFKLQAGHLKTHINSVHNIKKDHKCDSCGKTFSDTGNLKKHINAVHSGQKDHKCDSCTWKGIFSVRKFEKPIEFCS